MVALRKRALLIALIIPMGGLALWLLAQVLLSTSDGLTESRSPIPTPTPPVVLTLEPETIDVIQFERLTGLPLPDDAINLNAVSYCFIECHAAARFEIPQANSQQFFNGLNADLNQGLTMQTGLYPFQEAWIAQEYSWWQPDLARLYAGARFQHEDYAYEILIDQTNPNNQIIYIRVAIPH